MKVDEFIARQRNFFDAMATGEDWDSPCWGVDSWLDTRGNKSRALIFTVLGKKEPLCEGEAGADKWITEQERKIEGIRKAIALGDKIAGIPIKVFPGAEGITKSIKTRRGSSV